MIYHRGMNDYDRIATVIRYLRKHHLRQPNLSELAGVVGLSESHFHRLFTRWAGVTPKSFLQCLTLQHAKLRLHAGESVLDTALHAGLSGPGRLHDLCVTLEAASPGEIKLQGAGWVVRTGFADSPFGDCLVAVAPRGICHLSFVPSKSVTDAEAAIHNDWPRCQIEWSDLPAQQLVTQFFRPSESASGNSNRLNCLVKGTSFQVRVWKALLQIPTGTLASYQQVARVAGHSNSARAVGNAVAHNRIAGLIPCHRVIRSTGAIGQYRWGSDRKLALQVLEFHQSRNDSSQRHSAGQTRR